MRGENFGAMIITHYQRLMNTLRLMWVHVMMDGRIVASGGPDLAVRLEQGRLCQVLAEELGFDYQEEV